MRLKPFSKEEILSYKRGQEDKFINDLIIPLFEAVSEAAGYYKNGSVKIEYWGRDRNRDFGIDVYWGYTDYLGREQHYGIQVKTLPIIKRNHPNIENSIANIINKCKEDFGKDIIITEIKNQLIEGFNKEFENPCTFQNKIKINGFYIITSQKINRPARKYFYEAIQYFRNIQLFDCDDLYALIQKLTQKYEQN